VPLPWLLERLGFGGEARSAEEHDARVSILRAALARLDDLGVEDDGIRRLYESRLERMRSDLSDRHEHADLRRELLAAERAELQRLEAEGGLSFAAARRIERQLDLEEAGLRR